MASERKPSCRLFVIMAADAPVAAVLRRGPTAWYHLIRWDTAKDEFEHGAWIRGRIYEERCDVSSDGLLFLSFVHQGRRSGSPYTHAWTAVSRLPWLHALTLWPQGTTYGGGGRFVGKRNVHIRSGTLVAHPEHPAVGLTASPGNPPRHEATEAVDGADWAGRDQLGRLVFARGGKLFRCLPRRDAELADFNDLSPSPGEAPEWARAPLVDARRSARRSRGSGPR